MEGERTIAIGTGCTLDISSNGVGFQTETALRPGVLIELSVSWPVLLDDSCPMRLVIFGRVIRSSGRVSACTIDKYEFRTQSRTYVAPSSGGNDSRLLRWADAVRKEASKTTDACSRC
ncbi:MAG TPA: hypothetical protein VG675_01050 [Bryobacteraceae bacterium]|nr:hypothetical protein [Bryobacteraceae bacterium]